MSEKQSIEDHLAKHGLFAYTEEDEERLNIKELGLDFGSFFRIGSNVYQVQQLSMSGTMSFKRVGSIVKDGFYKKF